MASENIDMITKRPRTPHDQYTCMTEEQIHNNTINGVSRFISWHALDICHSEVFLSCEVIYIYVCVREKCKLTMTWEKKDFVRVIVYTMKCAYAFNSWWSMLTKKRHCLFENVFTAFTKAKAWDKDYF